MLFYSFPFLLFFLTASVLFHISGTTKRQHLVMLLANAVFYCYWDARFFLLLLLIGAVCYWGAAGYEKKRKDACIIIPAAICLLVLCVFKYLNFFLESFCAVFGIQDMNTLQIILPLGISFYLFQAMSYLFDVKKGVISAERDFVKLFSYISFFPQVTSGPIVKAHDFLPQLECVHRIKKENVYSGLQQFLLGLMKKVVFADRIGVAVNAVYQMPDAYNGISILMAVIGYGVQIYCDFSGYSDMAIGIARIWGLDLGRNFNMPYLAKNPSDFWKRWHISLSSWFREYVYIPLGGSRNGEWKTYRNLLITMVLSGVWHGASWTFVFWGMLHGAGSIVNKLWRETGKKIKCGFLPVLMNSVFVMFSWIVFRADSMSHAGTIVKGLFRREGILYINVYVVICTLLVFAGHAAAQYKNKGNAFAVDLDLDVFRNKVAVCVWFFLIVMFAYVGDSAFIYAQF